MSGAGVSIVSKEEIAAFERDGAVLLRGAIDDSWQECLRTAVARGCEVFVVVLFFGLVAVWVKGDLDWVMTYQTKEWEPTRPRRLPLARTVEELKEEQSPAEDHSESDEAADEETSPEGAEAPATA